jgi:ABC-type polar amino acid transport system ATPase subunit
MGTLLPRGDRGQKRQGKTMLATHEMAFSADVSTRVGFMNAGIMAEDRHARGNHPPAAQRTAEGSKFRVDGSN